MKNGNSFASAQRGKQRERERERGALFLMPSTSTFSLSERVTQRGSSLLLIPSSFLSFPFTGRPGGLFAKAAGEIITPIDRVLDSCRVSRPTIGLLFRNNNEQRERKRERENFPSGDFLSRFIGKYLKRHARPCSPRRRRER